MANERNLIPNSQRSPKEVRENGRKGGIKSGQVRKQRKTLREELLALLSNGDTQQRMSLAMIEKAIKGDTKAFEVIRDSIGEKQKDKIELEQDKPFEVKITVKRDKK